MLPTKVAAGLLNPITGKRLVKHKYLDSILPVACSFYRSLEAFFGETLLTEHEVLRIFQTEEEKAKFERRLKNPDYASYLSEAYPPGAWGEGLHDELGSFKIKPAYVLDTKRFLACMKQYFEQKGVLQCETFDHAHLRTAPAGVLYKDQAAKMIIFCEGYQAKDNPYFSYLPFSPAKGDILTLKTDVALPEEVLIRKQWMVSTQEGVKIGSTYNWDVLDEVPSERGKKSLVKAFYSIMDTKNAPEVITHEAGVRPATRDAHPFIGMHPEESRVGIFNGFGARGTLWVPFYARQFIDVLNNEGELHADVTIARV